MYNTISNSKKLFVKIVIEEAVPPQFLWPFDAGVNSLLNMCDVGQYKLYIDFDLKCFLLRIYR